MGIILETCVFRDVERISATLESARWPDGYVNRMTGQLFCAINVRPNSGSISELSLVRFICSRILDRQLDCTSQFLIHPIEQRTVAVRSNRIEFPNNEATCDLVIFAQVPKSL